MPPTVIRVSEFQIPDCNWAGSTAKLRRYYDSDWTDVDGVLHVSGVVGSSKGFFDEITCTLAANTITVPAFDATPTVTALINPQVKETWQLWDQLGGQKTIIADSWFIPASPTTTTRDALDEINQGTALIWPPPTYLDSSGVQALIDIALGIARFATSVIAGWVRLSVPAAVTVDPIAVGDNDPRIQPATTTQYGTAKSDTVGSSTFVAITSALVALGGRLLPGRWRSKVAPLNALDPLVCSDNDSRVASYVTPYQYGALGDATGATITSADVLAHGLGTDYPWVGTYVVGTDTKDYVGLQEAIYAAFYNGTLNPNGIANVHLNKVLYIPPGGFYINRRLNIRLLLGGRIMGAGRFVTQILSTVAGQACIRTNGMGYSHVEGIHFDTNANQVGSPLFELDWDNSSGGGALQSNTFIDCMFDGQHATTVDYGLRIGNTGFMGSENILIDCYFNTFKTAAWGTFNFNALQNTMIGGNIQGCPLYGVWCRQGSVFLYSVGFQNGIKNQIDVSGADLKISNSADTHSAMMDCRSESAVMAQSSNGHRLRLHNNSMRTDVTVWSAAQNYTVGQLITGTTSLGDGKLYIVVGAGTSGTGEPAWPLITPANSKFTVTGAMILATPTLTAPSGFFPAGIAGQTAIVPGAAFGGGDLTSVIVSRDSGTQLTLTDNALTTVSNKVIHWGTPFTATGGTATMIPYDFAQASVDNVELISNTFKLGYLDIGGNSDTLNPNTIRGNSFSRTDWSQNLSGGVFLQGAIADFSSNVVHLGGGRNTGLAALTPYGQSITTGVAKVFAGALSQFNLGSQALLWDSGISAVATPSQGFVRAVVDLVDARNMLSILYKLGGLPATGANSNTTAYSAPFDTTNVYISGGLSTGNVSGGTVHIQVAQAGSAGSSLNTPTDMLTVAPGGVAIGGGTAWTKTLRGTASINPASINANTVSSQTFTLTGALVGDSLTLNVPAAGLTAGLVVYQSFVSASDQITIVFENTTGAPIDEGAASWTYLLIR